MSTDYSALIGDNMPKVVGISVSNLSFLCDSTAGSNLSHRISHRSKLRKSPSALDRVSQLLSWFSVRPRGEGGQGGAEKKLQRWRVGMQHARNIPDSYKVGGHVY